MDTYKYVDQAHKKCRSKFVCKRIQDEEARSDFKNFTRISIVLCNATSESCEGACLHHDVGESVEQRETIEVETLRIQQSTFPRNSSKIHLHPTSRRRSSEMREKTKLADWSTSCMEFTMLPTSGNLIMLI